MEAEEDIAEVSLYLWIDLSSLTRGHSLDVQVC